MSGMKVYCNYDKMVSIEELKKKFNPRNRNVHPQSQIEHIALIMRENGIRRSAVVSNRSNLLTVGHGRILAAELNGWTEYPVNFQDYENEEKEYQDMTADNALAAQATLDLSGINTDLADLGPDFDLDLLGIKDFVLDPADLGFDPSLKVESDKEHKVCPNCGEAL